MADVFHAQCQEKYKLSCHLGMFALATTFGLYNLGAYFERPERHLAVNTGLYLGGAAWEVLQIFRHAKGVV
jgi:hypothetical protein